MATGNLEDHVYFLSLKKMFFHKIRRRSLSFKEIIHYAPIELKFKQGQVALKKSHTHIKQTGGYKH